MGQDFHIGRSLKDPLLIADRFEFAPSWPREGGQGLRMATAEHPMRLERIGTKQLGNATEKRAYSFNRLVGFDFVDNLDHRFISDLDWEAT